MKRKRKILFIFLIFLLLGISIYIYFYNKKVKIQLKDNLTVNVNKKVTNLSFIKSIKYGSVISNKKEINTSKLGKITINLRLKNKLGKRFNYKFKIKVVDSTAPSIKYNDNISTFVGKEIDLLKDVTATDNVDKDIKVHVEGEYDFSVAGTYKIYYVATDSSGNKKREEATLIVQNKGEEKISNIPPDKTFTTSKGFSGFTKNGITYIDGILIANKTYSLPSNYGNGITSETQSAFNKMKDDAASQGLNIYIISGFRSYNTQNTIYNNYIARDGKDAADTYSARPGHSEHQTGLAFDLNSLSSSFGNTNEGIWLSNNCYKYGFILRYTKDGENKTGYIYEPWHFRYVGKDLATKLYNNGSWITIEEYFGITSKY